MKNQPNDAGKPSVNIAEVNPAVNHAQNTAAFWFAELAPVSFFAPPAVQNDDVNSADNQVIPMNTAKGYCAA